jgi:hypothetical protein
VDSAGSGLNTERLGQAQVRLGLHNSCLGFLGPRCLFSKMGLGVRSTGLSQNPGPVGLGLLAYLVKLVLNWLLTLNFNIF